MGARNQGIRAEFLPEGQQYPEFGQCVHKVARHPSAPERLFAQNHGGVYRSDDEGGAWTYIADGLPTDFGFPMVVHPHRPDTIYTFPIQGGDARYPQDAKALGVALGRRGGVLAGVRRRGCRTRSSSAVMRDAMSADQHDPAGVYFGGRNGAVFASADEGDTWHEVVRNLPDVMVVRAAAL